MANRRDRMRRRASKPKAFKSRKAKSRPINSKELYIRDISEAPKLLQRPKNLSNAGNKTLPSVTTTF